MLKWKLLDPSEVTSPSRNITAITYNTISTKVYTLLPIGSEFMFKSLPKFPSDSILQLGFVGTTPTELAQYLGSLYVVNGYLLRGIYDPKYRNNAVIQFTGGYNLIFQPEIDEVTNPGACTITIRNKNTGEYLNVSNETDPTKLTLPGSNGKYFIVIPYKTFPSIGLYELRVSTELVTSALDSNVQIPKYGRFTYEINNNVNITQQQELQLSEADIARFAKALGVGVIDFDAISKNISTLASLVTILKQ
jgi:hypothetical protein